MLKNKMARKPFKYRIGQEVLWKGEERKIKMRKYHSLPDENFYVFEDYMQGGYERDIEKLSGGRK